MNEDSETVGQRLAEITIVAAHGFYGNRGGNSLCHPPDAQPPNNEQT